MAKSSSQPIRTRWSLAAGRNASGGTRPNSIAKAPDRWVERAAARLPLPDTSTSTSSSRSSSGRWAHSRKSPENEAPPAGASALSKCQSSSRSGSRASVRLCSASSSSIESPCVPRSPSRCRNRFAASTVAPVVASTTVTPSRTPSGSCSAAPSTLPATAAHTSTSNCPRRSTSPPPTTGSTSADGGHPYGIRIGSTLNTAVPPSSTPNATRPARTSPSSSRPYHRRTLAISAGTYDLRPGGAVPGHDHQSARPH